MAKKKRNKNKNDGQSLERLVKTLEQKLLPSGFRVETRVTQRDGNNSPTGEFDIVISGPLGSSSVTWLIECRDRPSNGSAPVSWIEQLIGRKARTKADKIIAVSSTGFSPAAIDLAEQHGILLRTVSDITDIADDFHLGQIKWDVRFTFDEVKIGLTIKAHVEGVETQIMMVPARIDVRPTAQEPFQPLDQYVYRWVEEEVLPSIDRKSPIITTIQREFRRIGWLDALVDGKPCRLKDLCVPVEVTAESTGAKVLLVRRYAEGEREIGHLGLLSATGPDGAFTAEIHVVRAADGTTTCSVDLPEGYPFDETQFEKVEFL
jgi:hypothetical protein